MKKIMEIALGIVTSVGGFLEIGSIATAAQAGADFSLQLVWAIVLGGICIIFLVEQAGRFAAVSGRTIPDAIRERFGFNYFAFLYLVLALVSLLVLAAEIGGVCIALELATGISFPWWAIPVALVIWLVIWKGTFGVIEKGVSLLGLVTLCFVAGAVLIHPPWSQVARSALPSLPQHDSTHYWFVAVSILGASISPYLFFFYSSGAIEDEWNEGYVGINRIIATGGMSFGSGISIAVLILAAMIFAPQGVKFEHYSQLPDLLVPVFGYWGFWLIVASVGIACLGAAMEITLELAYLTAQGFGWNWSENQRPLDEARFSAVYIIAIIIGMLPSLIGADPLTLTIFGMAMTAATLPVSIVPFLFLMNDYSYVRIYRNSWFSNAVVIGIIGLAFVLAVVAIPLQIFGGS
ncbi:MAG TPA: divalent metal cation transporter [Pyrinomonadaceae bacterium]|jgi:Mn2+/Fe2+ NRAMP family transporter|nr:divalent metal cation transporter [Pyrinomonadaceae bacterium]